VPRSGERVRINTLPLHFEKRIVGSHGGQAEPADDIPRYVNLLRQGRLRLADMITHRFPLERINEAVALMRAGGAGRCLITL
jgi:Zn-dependent alcohol dehydrogenase